MQTFPRHEASPLKTKQFELWYQPVYDLSNGTVLHNEILLRWRSPSGTLRSPRDFMPFIFEGGLEKWLDRFVLDSAADILDRNPRSTLSINLSREVLEDRQIATFIYDLIHDSQIEASRIHLEFSEKNISKDISNYISLIRDLKQIGCTVVLDNFANDYLTFMQWERLNVDFVKIRGDLIQESTRDPTSEVLLQSIFEVGSALDQMVVAKSIDAIDISMFLEKLSAGPVQGYHLKPPSPELCLTGKVDILGVPIDNLSMDDLLQKLEKGTVFTPNVDHLMNVRKHKDFGQAYSIADYKLCDSQILFFASRFLGSPIVEKISGSDLFPAFYQHHRDNPDITIFLLGGMGKTSIQAQTKINQKVNRNIVVDAYSPPLGFDKDEEESLRIVKRINQSGATVLAIGVGAPKQEKWIGQYRQYLTSVNIIFAIGATIDFEAGLVPRAPQIASKMGMEWLYRLAMEPKRLWKRYLINDVPFIWLLLKQKMLG
ncbi:WecB/TagA/CpsF family glycosyltransferase [Altericista sp. CCNU0014]|uniref:WecB/TagA/CpsF family glycosyltransferase n=1 Tax=Altericista sp. CCNU0014 TaxID=3082949 RepID=UPI00384F0F29